MAGTKTIEVDIESFEVIFDLQRMLMEKLGLQGDWGPSQVHSYEFLRLLLALTREVSEAADEIADASKPWKQASIDDQTRADRIIDELVDVFFYLMEAFIMLGHGADDLISLYVLKWSKNINRLEAAKRGEFENAP